VSQATMLRVRVDRERCQGHARCNALAPELFALDAWGNAREIGEGAVPSGLEDKARLAKANCPELAIVLVAQPGSRP
jgi:ferredoxin